MRGLFKGFVVILESNAKGLEDMDGVIGREKRAIT